MSGWLSLPLLVVAALLQATFMPQIRILGATPDLIFLLVVTWAVNSDLETGVSWAFVGGIAHDLLSAAPTGASVLGLLAVVFLLDRLKRQFFGIGILLVLAVVLFGTMLSQLIFMLVLALTGFSVEPVAIVTTVILPMAAYNVVFTLPVYWFVRRVQRRVA